MSRPLHLARRGLLALLALGATTAAPAAAATIEATYRCKYPVVGESVATVRYTVFESSFSPAALTIEFEDDALMRLLDRHEGAQGYRGTVGFTGSALAEPGPAVGVSLQRPFGRTTPVRSSRITLFATYAWPAGEDATTPLRFEQVSPLLTLVGKDGRAVEVPPLVTGADGAPWVESDADPTTFGVSCRLDPPDQDTTFEMLCVPGVAPDRPGYFAEYTEASSNSIRVRWRPFDGFERCEGTAPVRYELAGGGEVIETVDYTHTFTRLEPSRDYTFSVTALDAQGRRSLPLIIQLRTAPPPVPHRWALDGQLTLPTLVRGPMRIRGEFSTELTDGYPHVTARLSFGQAQGRLLAVEGALPVTAKIGIVPSGKFAGTFQNRRLVVTGKIRVKVQEVKLFGAIPIEAGNSCQTRQLSDLALGPTGWTFDPLVGGPFDGNFKISDLNGCGGLDGLVSPQAAGEGNKLAVTLTPTTS